MLGSFTRQLRRTTTGTTPRFRCDDASPDALGLDIRYQAFQGA